MVDSAEFMRVFEALEQNGQGPARRTKLDLADFVMQEMGQPIVVKFRVKLSPGELYKGEVRAEIDGMNSFAGGAGFWNFKIEKYF